MKKHNPHTPILIREAVGTLPRVYARYGMKSVQQRFNGDILTRLDRSRTGEAGGVAG